jgi:hypothetical protein
MPQAFGEFGLAKNAEVTNAVMDIIRTSTKIGKPINAHDIWKQVYQDLQDQKDLSQILSSLIKADKIQQARAGVSKGFLIKRKYTTKWEDGLIDYNILTEEERIGEHSNEKEDSRDS